MVDRSDAEVTRQAEFNEALARAQSNYDVVQKNGKGKFGPYPTYEDVYKASVPALNAEGIFVNCEPYHVQDRSFCRVRLQHRNGSSKRAELELFPEKEVVKYGDNKGARILSDEQELMKALTITRRNLLIALTGVPVSDEGLDDKKEAEDKKAEEEAQNRENERIRRWNNKRKWFGQEVGKVVEAMREAGMEDCFKEFLADKKVDTANTFKNKAQSEQELEDFVDDLKEYWTELKKAAEKSKPEEQAVPEEKEVAEKKRKWFGQEVGKVVKAMREAGMEDCFKEFLADKKVDTANTFKNKAQSEQELEDFVDDLKEYWTELKKAAEKSKPEEQAVPEEKEVAEKTEKE